MLVTHPKVVDVAVFGVPNEDFGEEVKAVVQPVEMPADDAEAARAGRGADRLLPRAARRRQVPALGRLPRRAAPPPDRQALQAPASRTSTGRPPAARSEHVRLPPSSGPRPASSHLVVEPPEGGGCGPIDARPIGGALGRREEPGVAAAGDAEAVGLLVVERPPPRRTVVARPDGRRAGFGVGTCRLPRAAVAMGVGGGRAARPRGRSAVIPERATGDDERRARASAGRRRAPGDH